MSAVSSPSFWRIRHLRFLIAANFCLTAFGLSAFRVSENVDASGTSGFGNDKAQPAVRAKDRGILTGDNSFVSPEQRALDVAGAWRAHRYERRAVLNTGNNSTGIETINRTVSKAGVSTIKVVNESAGPVKVWTAATPYVWR